MMLRTLNATGLTVTPLGLGMAALGRPGYINLNHGEDLGEEYTVGAMETHAHAVLDAAWDVGVRYFDAARSYGRAEEFLASWLVTRQIAPDAVTVGSKWGYVYTADWEIDAEVHEVKEHSLAVLRRQYSESRANLGHYLALYQVHSATLDSGVLMDGNVIAELARLRDEGLVIGLTLSGPGQAETLERAMERTLDGRPVFSCVQATWNLLEQSAGECLSAAHAAGMGVIVKEALANGRLTSRNDESEFRLKRQLLETAAMEQGVTSDALALAAVLQQPWVDVVLSGAATADQVRSNMTALGVEWNDRVAAMLAPLAESPIEYWTRRAQLRWN